MEETTSTTAGPNRTVLILLVAIVVLLAAIIAIIVLKGGAADTAGTDPNLLGTGTTGTGTTGTGTMGTGTTTEVPFDPATATRVAAGQTPEQHVAAYFDAVVAGDFASAYLMLPTAKQAEYGDEAAFTDQLTGYGVTAYTIDNVTEADGETQVLATATMPGGAFQYLWTFVQENGEWLVKSRTLPGMGQ